MQAQLSSDYNPIYVPKQSPDFFDMDIMGDLMAILRTPKRVENLPVLMNAIRLMITKVRVKLLRVQGLHFQGVPFDNVIQPLSKLLNSLVKYYRNLNQINALLIRRQHALVGLQIHETDKRWRRQQSELAKKIREMRAIMSNPKALRVHYLVAKTHHNANRHRHVRST